MVRIKSLMEGVIRLLIFVHLGREGISSLIRDSICYSRKRRRGTTMIRNSVGSMH